MELRNNSALPVTAQLAREEKGQEHFALRGGPVQTLRLAPGQAGQLDADFKPQATGIHTNLVRPLSTPCTRLKQGLPAAEKGSA